MDGRGKVRLRVSGLSAEKLLNAAREQGIALSGVKRHKNRDVTVALPPDREGAFRALAEEKGYRVGTASPVGALRLLIRLRRRWGLLAGALAGAALIAWSLSYVWQVRVENAGAYEGEVRAFLEETGIRPGIRRSEVDLSRLRDCLEWRLPQVKWVLPEWQGVALRVRLEPGTPPPDTETTEGRADVVAAEDGVLKRLTVFAGTPMAKAGDFVRAGQVLIRGEERTAGGETVSVRAQGEALARVWVSARVRLPVTGLASRETGRQAERTVIHVPGWAFSFQESPDYLTGDLETVPVTVGGAWAPLYLVRETYREVALETEKRDLEAVKREGAQAAVQLLAQAMINDEIIDKWINCSMIEGDTITVEATAEAVRNIGRRTEAVP